MFSNLKTISKQWRSWWDAGYQPAHLDLHCLHKLSLKRSVVLNGLNCIVFVYTCSQMLCLYACNVLFVYRVALSCLGSHASRCLCSKCRHGCKLCTLNPFMGRHVHTLPAGDQYAIYYALATSWIRSPVSNHICINTCTTIGMDASIKELMSCLVT